MARLVAAGRRPKDAAAELGLAKATVSHHLARLGVDYGSGYIGRRAVIEILGRSGVWASELCDLRIREVRLHDPDGARFRIRDAKTETGVREVQMTRDLVEAVVEHLDRLRRGASRPDRTPISCRTDAAGACRASGSSPTGSAQYIFRLEWPTGGLVDALHARSVGLTVAALGLALTLSADAYAAPATKVKLRRVSSPPAETKAGAEFRVKTTVRRHGRLRAGALVYYLSPKRTLGAGAVQLEGRTSLRPLRRRREIPARELVRVPSTAGPGRYYLVSCVAALRTGRSERLRLPCRASAGQTMIAAPSPKKTPMGGKAPEKCKSSDECEDDEPEDPTRIDVFPWVTSGGFTENWDQGLLFAGLGLLGGLVMVYLFLGGFLPSMGGKTEYEEAKVELEQLEEEYATQVDTRKRFIRGEGNVTPEQLAAATELTRDLEQKLARETDGLSRLRRGLVRTGTTIYVILGSGFAVLFAANALQAILFGFGWTAVADRIGLRKELDAKDARIKKTVNELRNDAQTGVDAAVQEQRDAEARADKLAEAYQQLLGYVQEQTPRRASSEEGPPEGAPPRDV